MDSEYESRVREIVTYDASVSGQSRRQIEELLFTARPIVFDGHFELLSTRHADKFFRFAAISQYPNLMRVISKEMVAWARVESNLEFDVVLSTARAGLLLAYDIVRELGNARAVYVNCDSETGYPTRTLYDGFRLSKGERVLIVNDVVTTGRALTTLSEVVESHRASVVGICVFASRGEDTPEIQKLRNKYNYRSIITVKMPSWARKDCTLCKQGLPLTKSRDLNSLTSDKPFEDLLRPVLRNVA